MGARDQVEQTKLIGLGMPAQRRLAIIGGGSVATSYFCQLVDALVSTASADGAAGAAGAGNGMSDPVARSAPRAHIRIFEPGQQIGPGGAYADDLESNLLNVIASGMSAFGDDKLHFMRWLQVQGISSFNGRPIRNDSFLSRPLFGRYLHAVYRDAMAKASANGIVVEHVLAAVEDVILASDGVLTLRAGSRIYPADHAVLAMGNLASTSYTQYRGNPRYFHSPYPVAQLAKTIPKAARVVIAGTSLSAIDAIVALASQGHTGKIICVSRSGRLPSVRGVHNLPITLPTELQALVAKKLAAGESLSLDAAIRLLSEELAAAGSSAEEIRALLASDTDAQTYLDQEIAVASSRPRQWQALGNILNGVIDKLWHLLPPADRQQFHQHIRPLWLSRRVAFPMENALILQSMMGRGQLHISGGLETIDYDPERSMFVAALSGAGSDKDSHKDGDKDGDKNRVMSGDYLINATSFSSDAGASDLPLLSRLLRRQSAMVDPYGGLRIDFRSGKLIDASGQKNPAITVLGSMAAGTYFWTNAMDVNARLAMDQARALAESWAAIPVLISSN